MATKTKTKTKAAKKTSKKAAKKSSTDKKKTVKKDKKATVKKKTSKKAAKKTTTKVTKAESSAKDKWGSRVSAQSGQINAAVATGKKNGLRIEQVVKLTKLPVARVRSHLNHLVLNNLAKYSDKHERFTMV